MNLTHKRSWKTAAVGLLVLIPIVGVSYSYFNTKPITFGNQSSHALCASLLKHYPPRSSAPVLRDALVRSGATFAKGATRSDIERSASVFGKQSLPQDPSTMLELYSAPRQFSPNPYMVVLIIGERDTIVDIVCY